MGLPADVDVAETEMLGLQLVHDLVDQLLGSVAVARAGATSFTVTFGFE